MGLENVYICLCLFSENYFRYLRYIYEYIFSLNYNKKTKYILTILTESRIHFQPNTGLPNR